MSYFRKLAYFNLIKFSILLLIIIAMATVALSKDDEWSFGDPHLNVIPRTKAETARVSDITKITNNFLTPQRFEKRPAGAATVRVLDTTNAFSQPSENISFENRLNFSVGNGLFRKIWVSSPSSTLASDGLGPLYNARSCQRCHIKDGRGHPPEGPKDNSISMLLKISVPGSLEDAKIEIRNYITSLPDPVYGAALQEFAVQGHASEYRLKIDYEEEVVILSDGLEVLLRHPTYNTTNLGYGPLDPELMISPRVAPQMIGLGLLEAIPTQDILASVDPDDRDKNGISGRANIVWSKSHNQPMLGRFGLKAGSPTLLDQAAEAFANDIGISSSTHPAGSGDCMEAQTTCKNAIDGNGLDAGFEIDPLGLGLVEFYSQNLGVPARRNIDSSEVLLGKKLFFETGCMGCHKPNFVTHRLKDQPEQSFQLIWPYTDMLLHDMGQALADNRPEARATGTEWRTPPLWGIGLTKQVSGHTYFLHDGRARSILEAILWHGGEAQSQRNAVTQMLTRDREALITFLESL